MPISEVSNEDCMAMMSRYPDNFFDLAIVDPPYGIERFKNPNGRLQRLGDTRKGNNETPTKEYFNELFRASKNQIIWGANHFWDGNLPNCPSFIFWDKVMTVDNYAAGEFAWTSFSGTAKKFEFAWNGMLQGNMKNKERRIHTFQKPVALYLWLLRNYAKPNYKILDTHLGSQSSRIAAWASVFDFWGTEIDEEYFAEGCDRFSNETFQNQHNTKTKQKYLNIC